MSSCISFFGFLFASFLFDWKSTRFLVSFCTWFNLTTTFFFFFHEISSSLLLFSLGRYLSCFPLILSSYPFDLDRARIDSINV